MLIPVKQSDDIHHFRDTERPNQSWELLSEKKQQNTSQQLEEENSTVELSCGKRKIEPVLRFPYEFITIRCCYSEDCYPILDVDSLQVHINVYILSFKYYPEVFNQHHGRDPQAYTKLLLWCILCVVGGNVQGTAPPSNF